MGVCRAAGELVAILLPLSVRDLIARLVNGVEDSFALDNRRDDGWYMGHIADAHHHFTSRIPEGDPLSRPTGISVAMICGSGYRSSIASSLLEMSERDNLINVTGGMGD